MHEIIGVITKDLSYIDKILRMYDETLEVSYDNENDYFFNPEGKFDWYQIGGRWNKLIEVNKDNEDCLISNQFGISDKPNNIDTDKIKYVDGARIKDILNYDELVEGLYGFVYNNEWCDEWSYMSKLNWNDIKNMPTNEAQEYQQNKFKEYKDNVLKNIDKELYLVMVDIHS